jgi:hypothetical protein
VRKVVAYELLSLDGVAEDPDTFIHEWDAATDANLAAVIAEQDAVIRAPRRISRCVRGARRARG